MDNCLHHLIRLDGPAPCILGKCMGCGMPIENVERDDYYPFPLGPWAISWEGLTLLGATVEQLDSTPWTIPDEL